MISFTNAAEEQLKKAIVEGETVRIAVQGGGCSGFQYGFKFDNILTEGDTIINKFGVTLLVDPLSINYLLGAEIDYSDSGLQGSSFIIKNPNATTTCGCGASFA